MTSIQNLLEKNDTITFDLVNSNSSFANALRRIIITNIPSVGFDTYEYQNSSLKIIENTSALTNEIILQRFGLIPIYYDNIETYDVDKYKFVLDVLNKTNDIIDVTTDDFKIVNLETNKNENNDKFFKKNTITGDPILILRLKPSANDKGEKLHIEGKSVIGIGKDHIRYSPVSNICFINKKDPEKVSKALSEYLETNKDKDSIKNLTHTFNLEEADYHFHTDENDDPNIFEFSLESCGIMSPMTILKEGLKQLSNKIKLFQEELEKNFTNNESRINIKSAECMMEATDIFIKDEDHTLGYIMQNFIYDADDSGELFVGYMNPHPLDKIIKLRIMSTDINFIKSILQKASNNIIMTCQKIISNINETKQPKTKKIHFTIKPKSKPQTKLNSENVN
jgi:DNA-directed RNA polymerase subunit L